MLTCMPYVCAADCVSTADKVVERFDYNAKVMGMTDFRKTELEEIEYLLTLPKVSNLYQARKNIEAHFKNTPPLRNYHYEVISDLRADRKSGLPIPFIRLNTAYKNDAGTLGNNYLLIEFHRVYPSGGGFGRAHWKDEAYDRYAVYYEVAFNGQSLLSRLFKSLERIKVDYSVIDLRGKTEDALVDAVTNTCIEIVASNARLLDTR
jgi:hypothetical protein